MGQAQDDEALAARVLERGLTSQARLHEARRRLEVMRRAGLPGDLLDVLEELTPAQVAELRGAPVPAARASGPADDAATLTGRGDVSIEPPAPPAATPARPMMLPRLVQPGDRIGAYVVERELGRGGMGAVYAARHAIMVRHVALKVRLPSPVGPDERSTQRFVVEAQAAARLSHPNVVTVHDAGIDAAGRPWMAMDLVEGEGLDRRVEREGPLPADEVVRIGLGLARALEHAHAQGVLHRDLKPANVLVRASDGAVLVTDFGLAKVVDGAESLTKTGEVLGTPSYMPPEQASGQAVDARADVWSVGATLYHLAVGRPPFQGAGLVGTLAAVIKGDLEAPRRVRPDLPVALEAVLLRCLARAPADRYPGAAALAQDLERLARGETVEAHAQASRARAVRAGSVAALAALAVAVVAVAAAVTRPRPRSSPAAATALAPAPEAPTDVEGPDEARGGGDAPPRPPDEPTPPPPMTTPSAAPFAGTGVWYPAALDHSARPPARMAPAMAYDARRRAMVLHGGKGTGMQLFGDAWTWDGAAWRPLDGAGRAPEPRYGHAMVYDEARARLVLHGGARPRTSHRGCFPGVWELGGDGWTHLEPDGPGPGARAFHGLAYDPARRRVMLFGGNDAAGDERDDLWAWDGERWTPLPSGPAPGPSPRHMASAAWDAGRGALVVFGASSGPAMAELWEWHPDRGWSRPGVPGGPGRRLGSAMAAGPSGVVVMGGADGRSFSRATWRWDGAWTRLMADVHADVLPAPRRFHALAWDSRRGVLVLFGGDLENVLRNDTWEFAPRASSGSDESRGR